MYLGPNEALGAVLRAGESIKQPPWEDVDFGEKGFLEALIIKKIW